MTDPAGPETREPEGTVTQPLPERRSYRVARAEKRAAMARLSWPEFWHDLGVRFLIAAAIVLVTFGALWLLTR